MDEGCTIFSLLAQELSVLCIANDSNEIDKDRLIRQSRTDISGTILCEQPYLADVPYRICIYGSSEGGKSRQNLEYHYLQVVKRFERRVELARGMRGRELKRDGESVIIKRKRDRERERSIFGGIFMNSSAYPVALIAENLRLMQTRKQHACRKKIKREREKKRGRGSSAPSLSHLSGNLLTNPCQVTKSVIIYIFSKFESPN